MHQRTIGKVRATPSPPSVGVYLHISHGDAHHRGDCAQACRHVEREVVVALKVTQPSGAGRGHRRAQLVSGEDPAEDHRRSRAEVVPARRDRGWDRRYPVPTATISDANRRPSRVARGANAIHRKDPAKFLVVNLSPMPTPLIKAILGRAPELHDESWVAPNATVLGQVRVSAKASVWYGAVLRAEFEPIEIGAGTNIQDGAVVHVDPGFPVTIGAGVSVGHNAVLHGCTVEEGCLIGMGSTVLNGAVIGAGSLVAAGALVPQGVVIPPRSLVAGVPGKVRRELNDDEVAGNRLNSEVYQQLVELHREVVE